MGLSTRQIPYIAATIFLFVGGILFFAFPMRNLITYFVTESHTSGSPLALVAIPAVGTLYMALLFLFVVTTFFLASFVDPGIYPRERTEEEDDFSQPLYRVIDVKGVSVKMKWCETCRFYRPPRTSHCSICDNCVEDFDHHCPWVDNCIGKRNYKYFFMFVSSLSLFILNGFGWGILSIVLHYSNLVPVIVEIILMVLGVLVSFPVIGLTGFHIGLICIGRTTNEHVTGKFRGVVNPYDKGCCRNCVSVLCAQKKPRYINYRIRGHASKRATPTDGNRDLRCMPIYEDLDDSALHRERRMATNTNEVSQSSMNPLLQRQINGLQETAA